MIGGEASKQLADRILHYPSPLHLTLIWIWSTCSKTVDEDELKMFLTVLINILNLPGGLYPSNITCNSPKMIPPQMSLFTFRMCCHMTCAT